MFLFVFWKKLKTPQRHFEIKWLLKTESLKKEKKLVKLCTFIKFLTLVLIESACTGCWDHKFTYHRLETGKQMVSTNLIFETGLLFDRTLYKDYLKIFDETFEVVCFDFPDHFKVLPAFFISLWGLWYKFLCSHEDWIFFRLVGILHVKEYRFIKFIFSETAIKILHNLHIFFWRY